MTADLSTLSTKADEARAAFEQAQAAADQARQLEEQRQAAERRVADEQFVRDYDDEQLGRDIRQAQQVREAVASDPLFVALACVYAAQIRRARLAAEAQGVASRLGVTVNAPSRPADPPTAELLMRYVADLGEDSHNAEQDG